MNKKNILGIIGIVLCFGVITGCTQTTNIDASIEPAAHVKEYKEISLSHDGWNTIPKTTILPAGENYTFIITPEKNGEGCMSTIKRAGTTAGDSKLVIAGEEINFIIDDAQPGEYRFVCNGMGMEQGKVIIEA